MKTSEIKPHKAAIFLFLIVILIQVPPVEALDRVKLLQGNFSNPLHLVIHPSYEADWIEFVFTTKLKK
ncbi:hypothetical protein NF865_09005 [Thermococcus aggregans]|uniref:Uncharacterized protein n=1 Tax=Thermococcus aggregans TaxID=110163 RepID=A0A9E7MX47_THEAG|nr:hypothetical protein [Thermococcus aggregans]USS40432.1 hypothetical protein NF865_09005 [Thermococcus aggregans]